MTLNHLKKVQDGVFTLRYGFQSVAQIALQGLAIRLKIPITSLEIHWYTPNNEALIDIYETHMTGEEAMRRVELGYI